MVQLDGIFIAVSLLIVKMARTTGSLQTITSAVRKSSSLSITTTPRTCDLMKMSSSHMMRRATLEQDLQNFSMFIKKSYPTTLTGEQITAIMQCLELGALVPNLNSVASSTYSLALRYQLGRENLNGLKLQLTLDITTRPTSSFKPVLRNEQVLIPQWVELVEG